MKIKKSRLLLIILAGLGIATFTYLIYVQQVWEEHIHFLNGTTQRGIMMQMTIDQFDKSIGRYPTCSEFINIYSYVDSFQQGVTMTNRVKPAFDNLGGWFYNEKSGEISINFNGRYSVGFMSWVELSEIRFHSPTKVKVIRYGQPGLFDYSYLNQYLSASVPDISKTVDGWAATNMDSHTNLK